MILPIGKCTSVDEDKGMVYDASVLGILAWKCTHDKYHISKYIIPWGKIHKRVGEYHSHNL